MVEDRTADYPDAATIIADHVAQEVFATGADVRDIVGRDLQSRPASSITVIVDTVRIYGHRLPEGWELPLLAGVGLDEVHRTFLTELITSMALENLKLNNLKIPKSRLQKFSSGMFFPGQIS